MKTYKVLVSEARCVQYLIKAENPEQAEDIYYGNELGEMTKVKVNSDGEYIVESVEEVR